MFSITRDHKKKIQLKIANIFIPINFSICLGCSKEPSQRDGSFEYPQHMFCLRNKKMIFLLHTLTKGLLEILLLYLVENICLIETFPMVHTTLMFLVRNKKVSN